MAPQTEKYDERIMVDAPVPGKRRRERQTTRWNKSCKRDVESVGLKEEDILDRTKWHTAIQNHSGVTGQE